MNGVDTNLDVSRGCTMPYLEVDIVTDVGSLKREWEALQREGTGFIYQNYDWVRLAYETFDRNNRPFIIVGYQDGKLQFVLPLVLVSGVYTVLRWVGGSHANTCCGLYSRGFLQSAGPGTMREVLAKARKKVRGIVVLHLKNQPMNLAEFPNPLLELPNVPGPNPFYRLDLRPGMDAILSLGNAKRKRKLFRHQQRVAEKLGGYELVVPDDREEINATMDLFFEHKARRFKELGIRNVFGEKKSRDFLRALALEPTAGDNQVLRLFVLKVGGKVRALYGEGILGDYCQSCINAVVYDEFAEHSPGEMILYLMLERLIDEGFQRFDLGIGYERYKSSWCKQMDELYETIYPLSKRAVPFSYYLQLKTRLKDQLKGNRVLWKQFKQLRKIKGTYNR